MNEVNKKSLEALDQTMQERFGGAMILLTENFRQTLPLIDMCVELHTDESRDVFSKRLLDIGTLDN